jgi:hypothetical protein
VIAVSLIVIDVTAGGAPELCEESVAAAMIHTNISDSIVANWISFELVQTWSYQIQNRKFIFNIKTEPVQTSSYRSRPVRFFLGSSETTTDANSPDVSAWHFLSKPFNSFIYSPAMTQSLWVTILTMTHSNELFPNFVVVWPSGRAKLIYLTSFDLLGVTASQSLPRNDPSNLLMIK